MIGEYAVLSRRDFFIVLDLRLIERLGCRETTFLFYILHNL